MPSLINSLWMRGTPRAGWQNTPRGSVCEFRELSAFVQTVTANASRAESLAEMLLDHSGRPNQHHRPEATRPYPVEPRPDQPFDGAQRQAAGLSATQNGDLVTKLEFDFDAALKPADEPREERRKQCEHTGAITASGLKSLDFSLLSESLAGTTYRFQLLLIRRRGRRATRCARKGFLRCRSMRLFGSRFFGNESAVTNGRSRNARAGRMRF
jgi:hypothetical protein